MKPTYNQVAASGICLCCLILLGLIYFIPAKGTEQGLIIGALIAAFSTSASFLVGSTAGSQAKDSTLSDALKQKNP